MQELETRENSFANVCRAEDQAAVRRPGKGYLAAKRCFDVVMSFLALILLIPLFLVLPSLFGRIVRERSSMDIIESEKMASPCACINSAVW